MNIREGVRRLLVVVSVVGFLFATALFLNVMSHDEPSAYAERQELTRCYDEIGAGNKLNFQYAIVDGKAQVLINGDTLHGWRKGVAGLKRVIFDQDIIAPLERVVATMEGQCSFDYSMFQSATNSIALYRERGGLMYNLVEREAYQFYAMYFAAMVLMWTTFYLLVWVAKGFSSK